ncbi:MAG TPA: dihydroorotase [Methylothermaceae bacterium]|nr:dihydroorotase [Methylothermaceae bacterium]
MNGEIFDGQRSSLYSGDIYIDNGEIVSIGPAPENFVADETINAQGCIVSPGFIDLSVYLREPGQEHKATIASETKAAAKSGVTMLCCCPETVPVIDTPAVVELIKEQSALAGFGQVLPIGALTLGLEGDALSEMYSLKQAGCKAVSNGAKPVRDTLIWRRALEYAATFDLLVIVRPQDPWLTAGGCVHEGPVASRLGLPAIPACAETVAVAQILALVEETGARVHFSCLSTRQATELLRVAQESGLQVTADVAAHQLHLVDTQVESFDPMVHVIPPLRSREDRQGLREAVAKGIVSAVCSDHQPHEDDAKLNVFPATEPGIASLETLLSLMLELVEQGVLGLPEALARLTQGPAGILGLEVGKLAPGKSADLCVFDPHAIWTVEEQSWWSQGRNTPFWGQSLKGRVRWTIVKGRIVYRWD